MACFDEGLGRIWCIQSYRFWWSRFQNWWFKFPDLLAGKVQFDSQNWAVEENSGKGYSTLVACRPPWYDNFLVLISLIFLYCFSITSCVCVFSLSLSLKKKKKKKEVGYPTWPSCVSLYRFKAFRKLLAFICGELLAFICGELCDINIFNIFWQWFKLFSPKYTVTYALSFQVIFFNGYNNVKIVRSA